MQYEVLLQPTNGIDENLRTILGGEDDSFISKLGKQRADNLAKERLAKGKADRERKTRGQS